MLWERKRYFKGQKHTFKRWKNWLAIPFHAFFREQKIKGINRDAPHLLTTLSLIWWAGMHALFFRNDVEIPYQRKTFNTAIRKKCFAWTQPNSTYRRKFRHSYSHLRCLKKEAIHQNTSSTNQWLLFSSHC